MYMEILSPQLERMGRTKMIPMGMDYPRMYVEQSAEYNKICECDIKQVG